MLPRLMRLLHPLVTLNVVVRCPFLRWRAEVVDRHLRHRTQSCVLCTDVTIDRTVNIDCTGGQKKFHYTVGCVH